MKLISHNKNVGLKTPMKELEWQALSINCWYKF